jgi:hypothetical protein
MSVTADERRSARADVARLRLELRALLRKAEILEASGKPAQATEAPDVDITAARELLAVSLRTQIDARRAELAAELSEARSEAARLVESAHQRADEYVAAAHDLVIGAALDPDQVLEPLSPLPLEVVADPRPATMPERTVVAAMQAYLAQATVSGPAAAPVSARRSRPPLRKRVLHLDVMLPLIAVAAVLLILLAWVG